MADGRLSPDVQRFIERHLHDGAHAEVLVLLHRQRHAWVAGEVARELRIDADQAERLLGALRDSGLLLREGAAYVWAPRDEGLAEVADRFCGLYPTYRVAVISLIFSKPSISFCERSDGSRWRPED